MSKSFISAALAAAYPAEEPESVEMGCRVADPALFADMLDRLDRPLAELAPDSSEARTVSGLIKHSTAVAQSVAIAESFTDPLQVFLGCDLRPKALADWDVPDVKAFIEDISSSVNKRSPFFNLSPIL